MTKWALQAIPLLFLAYVLVYAGIWLLWEYLWLSIPIFIGCYLLYRRYGTMQ